MTPANRTPDFRAKAPGATAKIAAAAEAAAAASPENATAAAATAAEAKEAAEEARRGVPRSARAHGAWICGAALGSEGYIKAKLKEVQIRLCGQEDSDGAFLTTLKELSDADPHAAHSAIHYSLQSRVDYLLETHLPDHTRDLAEAVDAVLRKCYLVCFGTDLLESEGQSGSLYQDDPSFVLISLLVSSSR